MQNFTNYISQFISTEASGFIFTLLLSLLLGIEREGSSATKKFQFGGARTYPLIALTGYLLFLLYPKPPFVYMAGFLTITLWLAIFYFHKVKQEKTGFTSELSALLTYIIGGLIGSGFIWTAVALTIVMVLLLQGKPFLDNFSRRIPANELILFSKFMLLTAVILPIVPNREFTILKLNPFQIWLIIIAVSGVSYISYLVNLRLKEKGGLLLTALLGGVYSSTVTTVVLAKQAAHLSDIEKTAGSEKTYAVSIALASTIMYLRILILVAIFNQSIFTYLWQPFLYTAIVGIISLTISYRIFMQRYRRNLNIQQTLNDNDPADRSKIARNPLELSAAVLFAVIFIVILTLNHYALQFFGQSGLYTLAAIMGFGDVDPFIMGLTQSAGKSIQPDIAAMAIIIAAFSNNLLKGIYALIFSTRKTGIVTISFLIILSLLSLLFFFLTS